MKTRYRILSATAIAAIGFAPAAYAQPNPAIAAAVAEQMAARPSSVGRGWPILPDPELAPLVGAFGGVAAWISNTPPNPTIEVASAKDGAVPAGIVPLERDIFTSDDFYLDRDLWSDPRYFRCNSGLALEHQWGSLMDRFTLIGPNPPSTGAWGYCDRDYPREGIVSPYPFTSAREHYEALMAEATARGGPTQYSRANVPDWDGYYSREAIEHWYWMRINQTSTILSLLTPEYQLYTVQDLYHSAHNNAPQYPGSYCWPDGHMRRHALFGGDGTPQILITPQIVQIGSSGVDNMIYQIHIGRDFNYDGEVPRLGPDTRQWLGESIGFWDEDVLIFWTSNIQGWTNHGTFEFSNNLQSIEILTPIYGEEGAVIALDHEIIYYDPIAFFEPLRIHRVLSKRRGIAEGNPLVVTQCMQTTFPINGEQTLATPGQTIEILVPGYFNRPWAQIWERYWEQGMQREGPAALQGLF